MVAVVGENGAGKSTLMGALSGSVPRDGGDHRDRRRTAGRRARPEPPPQLGVALVSQEFPLVGQSRVTENLLLGPPPAGPPGPAAWWIAKALRAEAEAMLSEVGRDRGDR